MPSRLFAFAMFAVCAALGCGKSHGRPDSGRDAGRDSRASEAGTEAELRDGEVRDGEVRDGEAPASAAAAGPPDAGTGLTPDGRWNCTGSHGAKLSCESPEARVLAGSRYDHDGRCFTTWRMLDNFCAVPTYCPGGDGETLCFVAPNGYAYVIYLLYGEELDAPGWHREQGELNASTLTDSEAALCRELWQTSAGVVSDADGGPADKRALLQSKGISILPRCASDDGFAL
jgi:hypothetical protein